jgi:hypothetical protein
LNFPSKSFFSVGVKVKLGFGEEFKDQGSKISKGIKGRRTKKTKWNQTFFQEVFLV